MLPDPVLTVEETPLSEDVREFCERNALFGLLAKAMELARQHFTIVGEPVITYEHDPDNDDEYLFIMLRARGSVSEVVQANLRYLGARSQFAESPEVRRLIRLFPSSCADECE